MMRPRASLFLPLLATALLAGCGGGGGPDAFGEITGNVFDADGNPVRDARVYIDGQETRSNSFGSFRLARAGIGDVTVRAEVNQGDARYFGQNVATVFEGADTRSVNIAVYPRSELASIEGAVFDREGRRLRGVRVFVRPFGDGVLSSAQAVSNSEGGYRIEGLRADTDYELVSNASGYGDDVDSFRLDRGERRNLIVTLGNPIDTAFAPPANLSAIAWTSPRELSRDAKAQSGYEALKRELNPRRKAPTKGRDTAAGNPIEVELVWDLPGGESLLGFGIYRGANNQNLQDVDFLRDPIAEIYTDADRNLVEGVSYSYALTTLNTSFPDTEGSESVLSDVVSVQTLGDLALVGTDGANFEWAPALGATRYAVFIFDEVPRLGITSRFNNFDTPTTGTAYTYDGPALSSGQTYYYLVLGLNDDGSSRTISRISSFIAP